MKSSTKVAIVFLTMLICAATFAMLRESGAFDKASSNANIQAEAKTVAQDTAKNQSSTKTSDNAASEKIRFRIYGLSTCDQFNSTSYTNYNDMGIYFLIYSDSKKQYYYFTDQEGPMSAIDAEKAEVKYTTNVEPYLSVETEYQISPTTGEKIPGETHYYFFVPNKEFVLME